MTSEAETLCLSCTLCCNGGLFADLKLSRADHVRLKSRANDLNLSRTGKLQQPCQALHGPKCTIYKSRPDYCRRFECLLLKKLKARNVSVTEALRIICIARRRMAKAERLLQSLGDKDQDLALAHRFRQLTKKLEVSLPDARVAGLYANLTQAMQALNHHLAEHFYC